MRMGAKKKSVAADTRRTKKPRAVPQREIKLTFSSYDEVTEQRSGNLLVGSYFKGKGPINPMRMISPSESTAVFELSWYDRCLKTEV